MKNAERINIIEPSRFVFILITLLMVCSSAFSEPLDMLDGLDLSGATHFVWEDDALVMLMGHRPKLTFDYVPTVEYTLGTQFTMRDSNSPHGPQNGQFGIFLPFGDDLLMLWLSGSGGGGDHFVSLGAVSGDVHGGYTHRQIPPAVTFHDFQPHWASINVRPDGGNAGVDVWIDNEYVLGWEVDPNLPALSLSSPYYPGVDALGFTNWYGEVVFDVVELVEVPEPATLGLLIMGGLALLAIRREGEQRKA